MAAEILTGNWDGALEEMQKLRESIDQKVKEKKNRMRF
jgi:translation initiation factor 3 subunit E